MGTCIWRGSRGVGLGCIAGCANGETEVARNTNHHGNTGNYTCSGGQQSYCCAGSQAPYPKLAVAEKSAVGTAATAAEQAAAAAAAAAATQVAIDIAAKAFCRPAVPALLAPLEAVEATVLIIGKFKE